MSNFRPSYAQGFARSAGESVNPHLWKGLVGLWAPSLGQTGSKLFDWSGFGNNGTLTNMDPGTDWVTGRDGYALDFDGTNDRIDLPNVYDNASNPQTTAFWIKPDSLLVAVRGYILSGVDGGGGLGVIYGINSIVNGDLELVAITSGDALYSRTVAALTLNEWQHIVIVWDGTLTAANIKHYRNAVLIAHNGDQNGTGAVAAQTGDWVIGGRVTDDNRNLDGQLAMVKHWNRILTLTEIQQLYTDPYAMFRPNLRIFKAAEAAEETVAGMRLQGGIHLSGGIKLTIQ